VTNHTVTEGDEEAVPWPGGVSVAVFIQVGNPGWIAALMRNMAEPAGYVISRRHQLMTSVDDLLFPVAEMPL
jgi:hypothetical protein